MSSREQRPFEHSENIPENYLYPPPPHHHWLPPRPLAKIPRRPKRMPSAHGIIEPHENDVLLGRGGRNNQHSGNERLREFARAQGAKYRISSKKDKSALSRYIVRQMRELDPPARYVREETHETTYSQQS